MLTRLARAAHILAAAALIVALCGPWCAPAARALTLTTGHIDAFYVTSAFELTLKDDSGLHAPEDVTLAIPASAYREETAAILGEGAYFLPQAQDPDLIWPGWDTTESGAPLSLRFIDVTGPGAIYLFSQGTFGGTASLLSDGGLEVTSGASIPQDHPGHVHANWAFTAPGTYTMTVQAVASTGQESNIATYRWAVGDEATPLRQSSHDAQHGTNTQHETGGTSDAKGLPSSVGGLPSSVEGLPSSVGGLPSSVGQSGDRETTSAAPGAAAGKTAAPQGQPAKQEERARLAETGISDMGWAVGILGIGMAVLGIGIIAVRRS